MMLYEPINHKFTANFSLAKNISGTLNLIILTIIFNILFLLANLAYNNIYIYRKIFHNEQNLYDNQINLDLEFITKANIASDILPALGFIPDDLTYMCHNGINVYEMYINNIPYGYWGNRKNKEIDYNHLNTKKEYYKNLIINKGFIVNKLNMIDLYNQNKIDEIFFIDQKDRLWNYDVKLNNFVLQHVANEPIVDYIIGNPIYNNYSNNKSLKYNIYTLHTSLNKSLVKLTYFEKQDNIETLNTKTIELLTSITPIDAIFMRANYIITISLAKSNNIYNNTADNIINIYRLKYTSQNKHKLDLKSSKQVNGKGYNNNFTFICNKTDIKLYALPISRQHSLYKDPIDFNKSDIELVWNEEFNYHQVNIYVGYKIISYYFKLKQDNNLLAYINIS